MNGFRVMCVFVVLFTFTFVQVAGATGPVYPTADKAPITMGTVPYDQTILWQGGPREVPKGKRCPKGEMPGVGGTTDASGGWGHAQQFLLDWQRANATVPEGGSGKWFRLVITPLKGKAVVTCAKEPMGAANTPPVTKTRVAITEEPERIELRGDNHMSATGSDARFGARANYGIEFVGKDLLSTAEIAFQFRQGWYMMEVDLAVAWDNQDDTKRSLGWTVGIRPVGGWFGCADVSLAFRGGESSHALVDYSDEVRLGAGVSIAFRPLWWLDNWAKEFVELRGEVLATQIYHEGDDFQSASWAPWVRLTAGVKASW